MAEIRLGLAWAALLAALALLLVIDFWFHEPFRKIDILFIAVGAVALLNAAYNERTGRYHAKVKIVRREDEPATFRHQTIMLVCVGGVFVAMGSALKLWGWYSLIFR